MANPYLTAEYSEDEDSDTGNPYLTSEFTEGKAPDSIGDLRSQYDELNPEIPVEMSDEERGANSKLSRTLKQAMQGASIRERANAPLEQEVAEPAMSDEAREAALEEYDWGDYATNALTGVAKGLTDLVDLPAVAMDIGKAGVQWGDRNLSNAPETEFDPTIYPTDVMKGNELYDDLTTRTIPEGLSGTADALRTFGEWGAAGAVNAPRQVIGGVVNRAKNNIGTIAGVKEVGRDALGGNVKFDILAGAGAAGGEALGGDAGEITSGMALPLSSAGIGKGMRSMAGLTHAGLTNSMRRARGVISDHASDYDKAMKNIQTAVANGEKGSLAQLAQDEGLYSLEARIRSNPDAYPREVEQLRELDKAFEAESIRRLNKAGGVSPTQAAGELEPRYRQATDRVGERRGARTAAAGTTHGEGVAAQQAVVDEVLGAEQVAGETAQQAAQTSIAADEGLGKATGLVQYRKSRLDPKELPSQSSTRLAGQTREAAKKFQTERVDPAWDAFKNQKESIPAADAKAAMEEALAEMNPTARSILDDDFNKVLKRIKAWDGTIHPSEIHTVVSDIKSINNNAASGANSTFGTSNKYLGKVGDNLEAVITGGGIRGQKYRNAVEESAAYHRLFTKPDTSKSIINSQPEQAIKRLKGEAGATTARELEELSEFVPQADELVQNVIRHEAAGEFAPEITDAFMKQFEEILERYPERKAQLIGLKDAQDARTAAQATSKTAGRGLDKSLADLGKAKQASTTARGTQASNVASLDKQRSRAESTAGRKAKSEYGKLSKTNMGKFQKDPDKYIDNLLRKSTRNRTDSMRSLYESAKKEGTEDSLKRSIVDRFINNNVKAEANLTSVNTKAYENLQKMRDTMVDSGAFTKAEMDELSKTAARSMYTKLRSSAKAGTGTKATAMQRAKAAVLVFLTLRGVPTGSTSLMLNASLKEVFSGKLAEMAGGENALTKSIVNEMLLQPDALLDPNGGIAKMTRDDLTAYLKKVGMSGVTKANLAGKVAPEDE